MARDGWTLDTLRIYLEAMIEELRRYQNLAEVNQTEALRAAMTAAEKAVVKSEVSVDRRLSALNEFRQALSDQQSNLVTRIEYDQAHISLVDRVDVLQARLDRAEGRGSGYTASWLYAVAAISSVGAIVTIFVLVTGR